MSYEFTDIFCGAGGSSSGLAGAGLTLKLAANHWKTAIESHAANFTDAEHLCADVRMSMARQHTFQVLTKRYARMRSLLSSEAFQVLAGQAAFHLIQQEKRAVGWAWPLPNVWLGVSVETQQWADIRIPALLDTPAAVRFLSCEPLLGPIDLRGRFAFPHVAATQIGWVIAGGESGAGARPMHPDWARSLRDQCAAAGVPFMFKQWGSYDQWGRHLSKKLAGRELDGRTWDEYPAGAA
jgi:protein gp37